MTDTVHNLPGLDEQIDTGRLCVLTGAETPELEKWRRRNVFSVREAWLEGAPWNGRDVFIIALLKQLSDLRVRPSHMRCVARDLYTGAQEAGSLKFSGTTLDFIYHATLFAADQGGYFDEIALADGGDPHLALYSNYSDFCRSLDLAGQLPSQDLLAAAHSADPAAIDLIALFLDLTNPLNHTSAASMPIWNFVTLDDEMVIQPRSLPNEMGRDLADGEEISCCIALSIPVLVRDVMRRARTLAEEV